MPYLTDVIPCLLETAKKGPHGLRESIIQQLAQLAETVQYHFSAFLPMVLDIVCEFWTEHLEYILLLVEQIAEAAPDDLVVFLPRLMPLILSSLTLPKVHYPTPV